MLVNSELEPCHPSLDSHCPFTYWMCVFMDLISNVSMTINSNMLSLSFVCRRIFHCPRFLTRVLSAYFSSLCS
uniref:Uncharacterized protein n=1 Tax=Arundo donax TaxID=35708 RepID=A0A0A8Y497_ARUDO